jgi:hypothetical protein
MRNAFYGIAIAATMVVPTARSAAQTVCLPNDARGKEFTEYMRRVANSEPGSVWRLRDSLRIPFVPSPTDVKLVTQEATCKKARDAYNAQVSTPTPVVAPAGRVYVVAMGAGAYAVVDPVYRYSARSYWTIHIQDSRYQTLGWFK